MRFAPLCLVAASLFCLASCGGGGDDKGAASVPVEPPSTLSLSLTTTSLSWEYVQGDSPASRTVTATVSGQYSGTVYAAARVENNGAVNAINPNITIFLTPTQASAQVIPASGLAAGTYTGRIAFLACSDTGCSRPIGGTPLYANFTVTVRPIIQAVPARVDVSAVSGTTVNADVGVVLGYGDTDFTVLAPSHVAVLSKSTSGLQLRFASLPVGTHNATLLLTGSSGRIAYVPTSYTVTPPAGGERALTISPASLSFSAIEGQVAPVQELAVTPPTWNPGLTWQIEYPPNYNGSWLSVANSPTGYTITASAANLPATTLSANIRIVPQPLPSGIRDPFGDQTRIIPVSFTVGAGLQRPADIDVIVDAEATTATLTGTVPINVVNGIDPVIWMANAPGNGHGVTVTPTGLSGTNLVYNIDPGSLNFGSVGTRTVDVNIVVAGTTMNTSFRIRITNRLARIRGAAPHTQIAGVPAQLLVTGQGLNGIANPLTRFRFTGATMTGFHRISDSRMMVDLAPLTPGRYTIAMSNNLDPVLGTVESSADFDVVVPPTYTYATIDTGYKMSTLIAHDRNGGLYAVDETNKKLIRFAFGPSGWSSTTATLNDVTNVGVRRLYGLIVTTSTGAQFSATANLVDDTSLAPVLGNSNWDPLPTPRVADSGLPMGTEGKAWLALDRVACNPGSSSLGSYNVSLIDIEYLIDGPTDRCSQYIGSLMFSASRFGDKFLLSNTIGSGPDPRQMPLAFVDTTTNTLIPTNSAATGIFDWQQSATSNNDASRTLLDMETLLDGAGDIIGRVQIANFGGGSNTTSKQAAVLSPSGHRAYVLTGPANGSSPLPRVYVVDTSTPVGGGNLPILGYFELTDCLNCTNVVGQDVYPPMAISMDGSTVFIGGINRLIIAPIPATLSLFSAHSGNNSSSHSLATTPWRISVNTKVQ